LLCEKDGRKAHSKPDKGVEDEVMALHVRDLVGGDLKINLQPQVDFEPLQEGEEAVGEVPEHLRDLYVFMQELTRTRVQSLIAKAKMGDLCDRKHVAQMKAEAEKMNSVIFAVGYAFWSLLQLAFPDVGLTGKRLAVREGWQVVASPLPAKTTRYGRSGRLVLNPSWMRPD